MSAAHRMTPSLPKAEVYDCVLRLKVKSRTPGEDPHLVQLDSYGFNGQCDCWDFNKFEKILAKGLNADQAVDQGLVKWPNPKRPYQVRKDDALRCYHLIEGRLETLDHLLRAFANAQAKHPPQAE